MKTVFNRKAFAFLGAAAVLFAAVFTVGCSNGTGGGSVTPATEYTKVEFSQLNDYLKDKASGTEVNYIEVTGLTAADLKGSYNNIKNTAEPSPLGKILSSSWKRVALKFGGSIEGLTDMSFCFCSCEKLTQAPVIPESVTDMRACFSFCTGLTQAPIIPESVTDITSCFYGCKSLTQAPVIPESVTRMSACFYSCKSLTKAPVIPANVTYMDHCFSNCTSLTKAPSIPANVNNMEECFKGCISLKSAELKCKYQEYNFNHAFQDCTSLTASSIKVPAEQLETYKNNAGAMDAQKEWFAAE